MSLTISYYFLKFVFFGGLLVGILSVCHYLLAKITTEKFNLGCRQIHIVIVAPLGYSLGYLLAKIPDTISIFSHDRFLEMAYSHEIIIPGVLSTIMILVSFIFCLYSNIQIIRDDRHFCRTQKRLNSSLELYPFSIYQNLVIINIVLLLISSVSTYLFFVMYPIS